jgi:transglutaminase-like putative cysteine protease
VINAEDVSAAATTVSPTVTYTPSEINTAATKVKTFVETNKRLPNYVTMKNKKVTMPQFLLLLNYDLTQTNSKSTAKVTLKNVKAPTSTSETVKSGSINKTEYIKLASSLKTNINNNGKVPCYVSSSRGKIKYETLVYTYSKVMDYYAKNKKLPNTVSVRPWNQKEGTTTTTTTTATSGTSFTIAQIVTASKNYRNYVDTNYKTPSTVTVNNKKVTTAQFFQLLSYAITQLNSGSKANVVLKTVSNPAKLTETVKSGSFTKDEYVKLAQTAKTATSNGKVPDYIDSELGKIRYETLTYIFAKTVQFYGENSRLPNTLSVVPYSQLTFTITGNAQAIVDQIGRDEATYGSIQGDRYSYLDVFLAEGKGNCWGSSLYLYTRLTAAGIQARIMGYVNGIAASSYKHAWVQINLGSGWKNWDYKTYASKHCGDVGGGTPLILIGPGKKIDTPDLITAYYAVL